MLEPMGLNTVEEALYLALVDAPSLTARDLATVAAVPEAEAEASLTALTEHGLITRRSGTPVRYAAVEPGIGLSRLMASQEQLVRRAEEQLEQAHAVARQVAERFRLRGVKRPLELIEVVVGRDAVAERYFKMEQGVVTQLRGIDMPPYAVTNLQPEHDLLERGAASRWLYDPVALDQPGKVAEIARFQGAGQQARLLAGAPFKLVIADDQQAMIALTDESTGALSALMVAPSAFLDGLSKMFEVLWRFAARLQLADGPPAADLPTPAESQLLAMLAAGMTDKSIARRLDVSPRTAQKRVQELMDSLGADTRFQAGLQARARGWL